MKSSEKNTSMNPEVKKAWIQALRSGNYEQGELYIRYREDDDRLTYCCLGVLCDLGERKNERWTKQNDGGAFSYRGLHGRATRNGYEACGFPPDDVLEAAGLDDSNAKYLAKMNDGGFSFETIAAYIEEKL